MRRLAEAEERNEREAHIRELGRVRQQRWRSTQSEESKAYYREQRAQRARLASERAQHAHEVRRKDAHLEARSLDQLRAARTATPGEVQDSVLDAFQGNGAADGGTWSGLEPLADLAEYHRNCATNGFELDEPVSNVVLV